jgi:acyl-coenzyme A thioesterase 13
MGTPEAAVAFLKYLVEDTSGAAGFDSTALNNCGIHSIQSDHGYIQCRFFVHPKVQNKFSILHGGCIATLVDVVGTAALMTQSTKPGKSVSIQVNYVSAAVANEEYEVRARVIKSGRHIATVQVDIVDPRHDRIVSHGMHVKYTSDSEPSLAHAFASPSKL